MASMSCSKEQYITFGAGFLFATLLYTVPMLLVPDISAQFAGTGPPTAYAPVHGSADSSASPYAKPPREPSNKQCLTVISKKPCVPESDIVCRCGGDPKGTFCNQDEDCANEPPRFDVHEEEPLDEFVLEFCGDGIVQAEPIDNLVLPDGTIMSIPREECDNGSVCADDSTVSCRYDSDCAGGACIYDVERDPTCNAQCKKLWHP